MNGQNRADVKIGARVSIVLKADQRTGKRTEGIVARLLTNGSTHPHGIKMMLEDGQVGRVQEVLMIMLYFSGTGNSAYIAEGFSQRIGADCHSTEEDVDFASLLSAHDTVAVCYPIYGSCVPRIMRDFVEKYRAPLAEKKLIILCTPMIFSGDGARAFARLLPGYDGKVLYAKHFNMPNNISNFRLFPVREGERMRKQAASERKLDRVCRDIQGGVVRRRGWSWFSALLGKLQNTYWPAIEEKQAGSFKADGDCNRCGLCVRRCPVQNLELSETGVVQKNSCTLCYRCVNLCPQKAATVMLHTKPKRQYKGIDCTEREKL